MPEQKERSIIDQFIYERTGALPITVQGELVGDHVYITEISWPWPEGSATFCFRLHGHGTGTNWQGEVGTNKLTPNFPLEPGRHYRIEVRPRDAGDRPIRRGFSLVNPTEYFGKLMVRVPETWVPAEGNGEDSR